MLIAECKYKLPCHEFRFSGIELQVAVEKLKRLPERRSLPARMLEVAIRRRISAGTWEFRLATCHCPQQRNIPLTQHT